MPIHTVSSRDFSRHLGHVKRLAAEGPVFIITWGKPEYALLKIEDYEKLRCGGREISLLELMDKMPRTDGVDYEAPRVGIKLKTLQE